jgi:hypothetical protein
VCFKKGTILNDHHAGGESTLGGNCLPGDTGWILEQAERAEQPWEMAKAACLREEMRLPELFELKLSCKNALAFGLNDMTGNDEWASNSATLLGADLNNGVAAIRFGGTSCANASVAWVGLFVSSENAQPFRCAK